MPIDTSNTRFAKTEPPCLGHPARAAQPALGRVLERTFSNPDPNPQHPALPSPHPRAPCPTFTTRLSPPSSGAPPDRWSALTFPAIGRAARLLPAPARSGDPRAPRPTFFPSQTSALCPTFPAPRPPSGALPDLPNPRGRPATAPSPPTFIWPPRAPCPTRGKKMLQRLLNRAYVCIEHAYNINQTKCEMLYATVAPRFVRGSGINKLWFFDCHCLNG